MKQSEIALLVGGYLKEDCLEAAAIFAATSPHLLEYRIEIFRNIFRMHNENPNKKLIGSTLTNILQEYRTVFAFIKEKFYEIKESQSGFNPKNLSEYLKTITTEISSTDPDGNEITTLYDSRVNNAGTAQPENPEETPEMKKSNDAQLVLGYLENECREAGDIFAATSPLLFDYRLRVIQKKDTSKTLYGMTLVIILQQYSEIFTLIQNKLQSILGPQTVCSLGDCLKNLKTILHEIKLKSAKNWRKSQLNLTENQEKKLNSIYQNHTHIKNPLKQQLAKELRLKEKQIELWFQKKRNHDRYRLKRLNIDSPSSVSSSATTSDSSPSPSTLKFLTGNDRNISS